MHALHTLTSQWEFYTRLFTVQSGMDESYGNGEGQIVEFSDSKDSYDSIDENWYDYLDGKTINFLTRGQRAAIFSWQDKRTLAQIEQMTGYKVKPRGVVSQFKHGGFVVYEKPTLCRIGVQTDLRSNVVNLTEPGGIAEKAGMKRGDKIISINDIQVVNGNITELMNKSEKENKLCEFKIEREGNIITLDIYPALVLGFGLVAAIIDLGKMDLNSAKTACEELILNSYSDWHLPSKEELESAFVHLKQFGVGGFRSHYHSDYWSSFSSTVDHEKTPRRWSLRFDNGEWYNLNQEDYKNYVRAVRVF